MATIFKNVRGWIAVFFAVALLAACGGGGSSTADTTPPTVSAFSVKNGAAITASSDASYAVSGNVGTTQEYTVTFSEKLDAASYTVKMLDTNSSPVALPAGMTATLAANDANNLAYTLTITTNGSFVFDAGQASKAVKLQISVADIVSNTAKLNVTETVNMAAPTVPANIPTSFNVSSDRGSINLSSYMQSGWGIQVVSVSDPGAGNGVGSPTVTVSGNIVAISTPLFYGGPYNIQITLSFTNAAGNSSNFVIIANNMTS
jgi:hypothetical protein